MVFSKMFQVMRSAWLEVSNESNSFVCIRVIVFLLVLLCFFEEEADCEQPLTAAVKNKTINSLSVKCFLDVWFSMI